MNAHPLRRIDDLRRNKRVRKGMFVLPSLFTVANMFAGYFAIFQAIQGLSTGDMLHFDYAAKAIGLAIVADGLDGRIARMTNSTSEFGKQLDSLADVITFGVAPAVLAYLWGVRFAEAPLGNPEYHVRFFQVGTFISFLFVAASASRLARFNIQLNPQPSNPGRPGRKYFVGLPTPGGAGVIAAFVHFSGGDPIRTWWIAAAWLGLVLSLGYLEVSTWRFYSFKDLDFTRQRPFRAVILLAAVFYVIVYFSRPALFFLAIFYIFSGLFARLAFALRRPAPPIQAS